MRGLKLLIGLILFVVMGAGVLVPPALASSPHDRFTRPSTVSFVLAECEGFDVIQQRDGWVTFTDFYDNNGNLKRSTVHAITHDRIYNTVTGFEVKNTFAYNQEVDPEGTEFFIRGVAYNITIPGYGIVYFDAGLGIFVLVDGDFVEVKFSGKYQADEEQLCEAMNQ